MTKGISVVITTKNEAANIINCLSGIAESFLFALSRDILFTVEVILVDNASHDGTPDLFKNFFKSGFEKIYRDFKERGFENLSSDCGTLMTPLVITKGPERSAQRNEGLRRASRDMLMYLDADMIISEKLLLEIYQRSCDRTGAFYIPEKIIGKGIWIAVRDFERSFYDGTVVDCVRAFSKNLFLKSGGFDETMSGPEDWDFDKKIRGLTKPQVTDAAVFHNERKLDFKKYVAKKKYYIKSFDTYISKWGKNDPDVKKQLGFFYRFFGVFFEKGNWKRALSHPARLIGVYTLRFLIGLAYLARTKASRGGHSGSSEAM